MNELLLRIALLAALTHSIRALSRIAGPQRGSLLLGLPSTTAVALVGCAQSNGIACAAEMAEACLSGLVAAVMLPLVFALALARGWQVSRSVAVAVLAYLAVAWGLVLVPDLGPSGDIALATVAILAAGFGSERITFVRGQHRPPAIAPSPARCLLLRTLVPAFCLVLVAASREVGGLRWAGLCSTFPGMTLAVLVVTSLESSPAEAGRLARALPSANLGMLAFIGIFRLGCPVLGLVWGTAAGYVLAVTTLAAVGALSRRAAPQPRTANRSRVVWRQVRSRSRTITLSTALAIAIQRPELSNLPRSGRHGACRRLSPLVEPIGL